MDRMDLEFLNPLLRRKEIRQHVHNWTSQPRKLCIHGAWKLAFLFLFAFSVHAQNIYTSEESLPQGFGNTDGSRLFQSSLTGGGGGSDDEFGNLTDDSARVNMYGDLRNDNPEYNPKSSVGMVALRVTLANVSTWAIDRFIFNYDFVRVTPETWKHNLQSPLEWDVDRFGMNYFFHPFSGGMFFNAARANGFNFYESIPFAFLGSLEWEYFGEITHPSYNDLINTPVNGVFYGEIFYRLGSNILDDQTSGWSRFFREAAVAIMTPTRFFSRLMSGALTRTTTEDVYQKEPLNITLSGGYHRVN
ncbi:MAG: DUF3943 domain-containing protein, partial [Bacteroidota bacterium]